VPIKSDFFYHFSLWVAESLSQLLHLIRSQLPSKLPASLESQRNNILDAKPDLETELRKTLLNLCFTAALQITIQYKQVAESEIHKSINLISLAIAAIFASLFISQFIGKKIPNASEVFEKVAFFLAATTFSFAIATPFPLSIKFALWAVYFMSLITINAICNCL